MNCLEFYSRIGANAENVNRRLGNETFVKKYLKKFAVDKTVDNLKSSVEKGDYEEAFRSAHTIKGLALNLELLPLVDIICNITECLRDYNESSQSSIVELLNTFNKEYEKIISDINQLQ